MSRLDREYCVGFGNCIRTDGKKTWCGKDNILDEPFFHDVTAAALNGEKGNGLIVCPECLKKITECLNN